jgi:DNA-binding NtrC family response regulator
VSKSILLVTSEPHPASQQVLADLGAIQISSADEAAKTGGQASYDLVVVDDQPSTVELVAKFHDRYPKLPIVVLNSDRSWQRARDAWRAGATNVVSKQPDDAELSQAVKQILGLTERSILFVDDDPEYLNGWARLLRDDGYSVATASTPAEALRAIDSQPFGLAVVDVRLERPSDREDKSGLRVAEAASRKGIATIVLTGHPDFERLREAMYKGKDGAAAIDFVYKGEGFTALRDRIEAAFRRFEEH